MVHHQFTVLIKLVGGTPAVDPKTAPSWSVQYHATGFAGRAGSVSFPKSVRFAAELETATWLQGIAKTRGYKLTLIEAHEVWAEHSDAYCAQWLLADSENPKAEAWRAITVWWHRHRKPNTQGLPRGGQETPR